MQSIEFEERFFLEQTNAFRVQLPTDLFFFIIFFSSLRSIPSDDCGFLHLRKDPHTNLNKKCNVKIRKDQRRPKLFIVSFN